MFSFSKKCDMVFILMIVYMVTITANYFPLKTSFVARKKTSKVNVYNNLNPKNSCNMGAKIINCTPDLKSRPKITRYRETIFLGSILAKNCNVHINPLEGVRMKWEIWNVENTEREEGSHLVKEIYNKLECLIEEDTLLVGIYKLKLTANSIFQDIFISSVAYCFFEVVEVSTDTAILGGDIRLIYYKMDINFDVLTMIVPGRYDVYKTTKTWYMWWCDDNSKTFCWPFETSETHRYISGPFKGKPKLYNFTLKVHTPGNLGKQMFYYVNQIISVTDEPAIDIGIICLLNCGQKTFESNPLEVIHIEAKFNRSVLREITSKKITILWFYATGSDLNTINPIPKTMLSNDSETKYSEIRIKEGSLHENEIYSFSATSRIEYGKELGRATIKIKTSILPKNVMCMVSPDRGIFGITLFDIACSYNNTEVTSVMYEFYNRNSKNETGRHLGFSLTGTLEKVILTRSELYVRTTNFFGAFYEKNISINLTESSNMSITTLSKVMSVFEFGDNYLHTNYIYRMNLISGYSDLVSNQPFRFVAINTFLRKIDFEEINDVTGAIMLQNVLSNVACRIYIDESKVLLDSESVTLLAKIMFKVSVVLKGFTISLNKTSRFVTTSRMRDIAFTIVECANLVLENNENYVITDYAHRNNFKKGIFYTMKAINNIVISVISQQIYAVNDFHLKLKHIDLHVHRLEEDVRDNHGKNNYVRDVWTMIPKFHLQVISYDINPYWWSNGDQINTVVKSVQLTHKTKKLILLYTNKKISFYLNIQNFSLLSVSGHTKQPNPYSSHDTNDFEIAVHRLECEVNSLSFINFSFINNDTSLRVVILQGKRPDYDYMSKSKIITAQSPILEFRMMDTKTDDQFFYIGILPGNEVKVNDTTNYSFTVYSAACKIWLYEMWITTSQCRVGNNSTRDVLNCICPYNSKTVGGYIYIPSHKFNPFSNFPLFISGSDYSLVLIILVLVLVLYLLLLMWTVAKDKDDKNKINIIVLHDNDPRDSYGYLIGVFTGTRIGAGTTSNVGIRLLGDEGISRPHILSSHRRPTLKCNMDDWFLLFTHHHLGTLTNIQLWIDQSGQRPNWYCSKIVVFDVHKNENDFFFIESWFGTNIKDIHLKSLRECATYSETNHISRIISENLLYGLRETHYWASVFFRHPRSLVTRTQRLSFVISGLFVTMLTCTFSCYISFPNLEDYPSYTITKNTIIIGFIGSLVGCLVSFIVWNHFYSSNTLVESPLNFYTNRNCRDIYHFKRRISVEESGPMWFKVLQSNITKYIKPIIVIPLQTTENTVVGIKSNKQTVNCTFLLCGVIIIVSGHFIFLSSLQFGRIKILFWITSILFSLIQTILIIEPIKIFIIAVLLGITKLRYYELMTYSIGLERILQTLRQKYSKNFKRFLVRLRNQEMYKPPTTFKILKLKPENNKFVFLLAVYYTIGCAVFIGVNMWLIQEFMLDYYFFANKANCREFGSHETCESNYRMEMDNILEFLNMLSKKILPALYTQMWYNRQSETLPDELFYDTGWLKDGVSRLIGPPRLRQLRIKPNQVYSCYVPDVMKHISPECLRSISSDTEDQESYGLGWSHNNLTHELFDLSPWEYTKPTRDIGSYYLRTPSGYTFHDGGYIANLQRTLIGTKTSVSSLFDTHWIDNHTRIIITEFTTYNVNNDLFTNTVIMTEVMAVGSVVVIYYIRSIHLSSYIRPGILFFFSFLVFGLQFISLMNIIGVQKFLSHFWNLYDCFILCIYIVATVFYLHWVVKVADEKEKLQHQGKDTYFAIDNVLGLSLTVRNIVCVLFCLMLFRSLRIIRFNKDIKLYSHDVLASRYEIFFACVVTGLFIFIQFRLIMFLTIAPPAYSFKDVLIFRSRFKRSVRYEYQDTSGKVLAFLLNFTSQLGMFSFMISQYNHYKKAQETRTRTADVKKRKREAIGHW